MARFAVLALAVSAVFGAATASPISKRQGTGRGTWYETGLGACGINNVDTDYIIALSHDIYNDGQYCGQTVQITNTANGYTSWAAVEDECMGCGATDIDMSPSLFESLGEDLSVGVLQVSWNFDN